MRKISWFWRPLPGFCIVFVLAGGRVPRCSFFFISPTKICGTFDQRNVSYIVGCARTLYLVSFVSSGKRLTYTKEKKADSQKECAYSTIKARNYAVIQTCCCNRFPELPNQRYPWFAGDLRLSYLGVGCVQPCSPRWKCATLGTKKRCSAMSTWHRIVVQRFRREPSFEEAMLFPRFLMEHFIE